MKEIKEGSKFLCIKDYVMEDGEIAYTKGKIYTSEGHGCITDDQDDHEHFMDFEPDFFKLLK